MEKVAAQPKWVQKSFCFQGRGTPDQRLHHNVDPKELFIASFDKANGYNNDTLGSGDYSDLAEDSLDDEDYIEWHDLNFQAHDNGLFEWVEMLCLCNKTAAPNATTTTFAQLHDVLRTGFGLEAIVLHEVLSDKLTAFIPHSHSYAGCSYYTTCFLTLSETRLDDTNAALFLKEDNHLALHEPVDPARLMVNEKRRTRFARAMRIFDLQPFYHLTELEAIINPTIMDNSLWEICCGDLPGCPKPTNNSLTSKQRNFKQFLKSKSDERAKESWPQLKIITASDAVAPTGQRV